MKTSLDHLPPNKQDRVRAIARLIREAAPVEMIILYGSFARGGWVDDPAGGYVSDYDFAIITKDNRLANNPDLWGNIERNAQRLAGRASVSFIIHDIRELNHHLRSGHYFFTDLVKEGVLLHDAGASSWPGPDSPRPPSACPMRAHACANTSRRLAGVTSSSSSLCRTSRGRGRGFGRGRSLSPSILDRAQTLAMPPAAGDIVCGLAPAA